MLAAKGKNEKTIFDAIFRFAKGSLSNGRWGGYYNAEHAVGMGLLTFSLNVEGAMLQPASALERGKFCSRSLHDVVKVLGRTGDIITS
jgi:hypothetical protein